MGCDKDGKPSAGSRQHQLLNGLRWHVDREWRVELHSMRVATEMLVMLACEPEDCADGHARLVVKTQTEARARDVDRVANRVEPEIAVGYCVSPGWCHARRDTQVLPDIEIPRHHLVEYLATEPSIGEHLCHAHLVDGDGQWLFGSQRQLRALATGRSELDAQLRRAYVVHRGELADVDGVRRHVQLHLIVVAILRKPGRPQEESDRPHRCRDLRQRPCFSRLRGAVSG